MDHVLGQQRRSDGTTRTAGNRGGARKGDGGAVSVTIRTLFILLSRLFLQVFVESVVEVKVFFADFSFGQQTDGY